MSDKSPAMPVRRRYESSAATGRGLELLEALAADWGVTATDDGKVVWCTVQAADDRDGEPTGDATIAPVEHLADSKQTTGTGEAERASFARAA